MNPITDEILNRYIDGELNTEESEWLVRQLAGDKELKMRLNSLMKVHRGLQSISEDEVSYAFTERVMRRIAKKYKVPREQKLFITFVFSFFGIVCLSLVGYLIINLSGIVSEKIPSGTNDSVNRISESFIHAIVSTFSGLNISLLGSILSIILLTSGYFFYEMTRQTKTKFRS